MAQSTNTDNEANLVNRLAGLADQRVQAQLTAALAGDQRALVFAGLVGIAAAALGGGAASMLTAGGDRFMAHVSLVAAGGMLLAMLCAIIAARPVKWFYPGTKPASWRDDIASGKDVADSLRELLDDYDDRITGNETTMRVNGRWLLGSGVIALSTLLGSGVALVCYAW